MKSRTRVLMTAILSQALTSSAQVYNILHSFNSLNHDGTGPRTR